MPGVLYRKEREVLAFIAQFQTQHGYSPTLKEIAEATGHRANSTIHSLIRSLVEKGYIQKVDGNTRVLKIIDEKMTIKMLGNEPSIELPLMAYISSGKPLEPYEDPNATMQISGTQISGKRTAYILQVRGDSLVSDGLQDGDYIIVEKTHEPKNGDVIVALVENSFATVKKFQNTDGKVALMPLHGKNEPVYPEKLLIQGCVACVIRKFI